MRNLSRLGKLLVHWLEPILPAIASEACPGSGRSACVPRVTQLEKRRVLNGDPVGFQAMALDTLTSDAPAPAPTDGQAILVSLDQLLAEPSQFRPSAQSEPFEPLGDDRPAPLQSLPDSQAAWQIDGGQAENAILRLEGSQSVDRVVYELRDGNAGTIYFEFDHGVRAIDFSNLSAVDDQLSVETRVFDLRGSSDQAMLQDGLHEGDGLSQFDSSRHIRVLFTNPTELLQLRSDSPSTDITATMETTGLDEQFAADLQIVGGNDDVVLLKETLDLHGGDLSVYANTIEVSGVITAHEARIDLDAVERVELSHDARLFAELGNVEMSAAEIEVEGEIVISRVEDGIEDPWNEEAGIRLFASEFIDISDAARVENESGEILISAGEQGRLSVEWANRCIHK